MALDYTGSNNGLFVHLGKIAKNYLAQKAKANDLIAERDEIVDAINAMNAGDPKIIVEGFASTNEQWRNQYASRAASLVELAEKRLLDRETVQLEIGAIGESIDETLRKLIDQMTTDGESIDGSAITLGSITTGASNAGNGTLTYTSVLDAITPPGANFPAMRRYRGKLSQLAPTQNHRIVCERDSFADGTTSGSEDFSWEGDDAELFLEGEGLIGRLQPTSSNNQCANGDFENFGAANTPDEWSIATGTAGTHIHRDTANAYVGASGLKFTGDGTLSPKIIQENAPRLIAGKRYIVHLRIKGDASIAAGTLVAKFEGTGYTAGSGEDITVAHGSIPTSWTLKQFFITIPPTVPADFKLSIAWTLAPTNTKRLWIDDVTISPFTYGAGFGIALIRGSSPFARGDNFSFATTNSDAGTFQKFFRLAFGVQLPFDLAGGETIADSLAE